MLDQPKTIRQGEELNSAILSAYLRERTDITSDVDVAQFPSGFSNLTYMLSADTPTGRHEFVLRRPPFGANIKSAHDMEREFKVLSALKPLYDSVPLPVLYCGDESVLGAPFYLMERVEGIILRGKPPVGLDISPSVMQRLSTMVIDKLAELHAIDISSNSLKMLGKPEGYVQRQVEGWVKRYANAKTDEIQGMEQAAVWLAANMPSESSTTTLIHNDFKYDNVVFAPDLSRISAVLDWEMATIGDPLMDLGTTLGYWAEENDPPALRMFGLTSLAGNLTREELVARYALQTARDPDTLMRDIVFYYVFGLFKIGVIAQQIYSRFKQGFSKDERFGGLIHIVEAVGSMAQKALQTKHINSL